MSDINLNKYSNFVDSVMSSKSKNLEEFIAVLRSIEEQGVNAPLLNTGAIGLAGESGEFNDIVKKVLFQGKPLDEKTKQHLMKELGDVFFYWITACRALNLDPDEVIGANHAKLGARYPDGFSSIRSENKAIDDL